MALNFKVALQDLAKIQDGWVKHRDHFCPKNRSLAVPCMPFSATCAAGRQMQALGLGGLCQPPGWARFQMPRSNRQILL